MAAARARIYLDHNATTPVDPDVIEAVAAAMRDDFGNASSVHHFGQQAKARLDDARQDVAALIGGAPTEVVFTSGGTEADNFALRGVAEALEPFGKRHLVTSSIEHEAVLTHDARARAARLARHAGRARSRMASCTPTRSPPRSTTTPRCSA